jgi:ferredoxin
MATVITSECINCGACEPECPNTAIYQGGVEWELNGVKYPPLSQDYFYIVPEKCTECVGFHDKEACAVVCPVDCCIPDPERPETEDVLLARARELHPDKTFEGEVPSRFRAEGGGAVVVPAAGPSGAPNAPAATGAATPAKTGGVPGRVERALSPPRARVSQPAIVPMREKAIPGELPGSFEAAMAQLGTGNRSGSAAIKWLVALAQPLLGALPNGQKKQLEAYVGDPRFFTAAGATGVNALHNMILYPAICAAVGVLWLSQANQAMPGLGLVFTDQLVSWIIVGLTLAVAESILRMRDGWKGTPPNEATYGPSAYGIPLAAVFNPLMRILRPPVSRGTVAIDGFRGGNFEEKMERERRYGEVYSLEDMGNGYLLRLEFPRRVPPSALKEELGVADAMPPYDYDLKLEGSTLVVRGNVTDENVRKVAAVSPAFPPDFTTRVSLPSPVSGFKHRIREEDRILEVVLLKR